MAERQPYPTHYTFPDRPNTVGLNTTIELNMADELQIETTEGAAVASDIPQYVFDHGRSLKCQNHNNKNLGKA